MANKARESATKLTFPFPLMEETLSVSSFFVNPESMIIDGKGKSYDYVRSHLFDGSLKQKQVDGMNALLDYWDNEIAEEDDRWLAYVLATVHHESDRTMAIRPFFH